MSVDETFKDFILDQLIEIEDLHVRKMFGSFGIYSAEHFFGIISSGKFYLKTDKASKQDFIAHGMQPFAPSKEQLLKNYYEVPVEVFEDSELLTKWVMRAIGLK